MEQGELELRIYENYLFLNSKMLRDFDYSSSIVRQGILSVYLQNEIQSMNAPAETKI